MTARIGMQFLTKTIRLSRCYLATALTVFLIRYDAVAAARLLCPIALIDYWLSSLQPTADLQLSLSGVPYSLLSPGRNVLVVLSKSNVANQAYHQSGEYCHSETFSMSCSSYDEVIIIRSAEYGRMRVGRCVHDSAYVGCRVSVLSQLDRMCSGRPSCHVALPNPVLDAVDPCLVSSVKSYLQVAADCQTVTAPIEAGCSADRPALVHGLGGYLSNYRPPWSTPDVDLSPSVMPPLPCPWRIVVGRGQRINLTLVDFATPRVAADVGLGCLQYAVVTERVKPPRTVRVCGGHRRRRHLHTSSSNAIDVHVTSARHNVADYERFYFLLHYKALGCPEVQKPRYGWLVRERPDIAMLGCNESSVVWRLTCDDNRWTGPSVNCSPPAYDVNAFLRWDVIGLTVSNDIALGAVAVVGALLVFVLLLCTMICVEWLKSKRSQGRHVQLGKSSLARPGSTSTTANIRSVSGGTAVSAASGDKKTDTTGLLRPNASGGGREGKKRARRQAGSSAVTNHVIHVDMTVDDNDDDDDDEDDVDDAVIGSSSPSPPPPPRRDSAAELSYVREMWPMAPPPLGNACQLVGPLPPSSSDQPRATNHRTRPVSSYVAGEYVSLAAFGLPPGTATSRQAARRSTPAAAADDDVTRIRETPKYLRRERCATMRGGGAVWQPQQQQQHFEAVTNGYDDYDGDDDDDAPYQALAQHGRSTTLPRGLAASGTGRIS